MHNSLRSSVEGLSSKLTCPGEMLVGQLPELHNAPVLCDFKHALLALLNNFHSGILAIRCASRKSGLFPEGPLHCNPVLVVFLGI